MLAQFGLAPQDTPVVIVHGRLVKNPSNTELAAEVRLPVPGAPQASCDLLVVRSGPAGLSAAMYGASEGLQVIVLDATATKGQVGTSSRIENYLGFPSGISGAELADRAVLQARKFGARFAVPAEAASIEQDDGHYRVRLGDGSCLTSPLVVRRANRAPAHSRIPGGPATARCGAERVPRQGVHHASSGDPAGPAGYLRRLGASRPHRAPAPSGRHRGRADPGPSVRPRSLPSRPRPA